LVAIGVAVLLIGGGVFAMNGRKNSGLQSKDSGSNNFFTKEMGQLIHKGLAAEGQGDYAYAKKIFEELLKADSTNKFAHYNLGYIAQTQDRDDTEATKHYEAALKTDPEYGPALYNLAIIKTANGDDAGAILLYQRAGTANPSDANTQLNLGLLLYKTGDTAGADAALREAISLDPELRSRIPANQLPN